jgi:hypothetical protein
MSGSRGRGGVLVARAANGPRDRMRIVGSAPVGRSPGPADEALSRRPPNPATSAALERVTDAGGVVCQQLDA